MAVPDESWEESGKSRRDPAVEASLKGMCVLVTRPAHQADVLVRLIETAGGEAVRLPTIEIVPAADPAALSALFDRLPEFDLAIFLSQNAVQQTLPLLRARGLPPALRLAAVGQGTQQALRAEGFENVLAPVERFDSEALLELLPRATVLGKNILIVRGSGGRKLLSEQLSVRGAHLSHADCYQRLPPRHLDPLAQARLQHGEIDIISITSVEGLHNLYNLVGTAGRAQLLSTAVLTVSERQAQACRELGFRAAVQVATRASDAAIVGALCAWQAARNSI